MNNKPMELVFDMISYLNDGAKGKFRITNKAGVQTEISAKKIQSFVAEKIQDFMLAPYSETGDGKAIQAFTGTSDLTAITTSVWNAFQSTPNYDLGWQQAFKTVPLRKGQLSWTIGTVSSGVVLKILEEGSKVEYATVTGTTATGEVELYGSGVQISWKTLEGRDLAAFYNAMDDFRNKRMKKYADIHYLLLYTAAANTVTDYALASTDATLQRDITTLSNGYDTIADACKDLGLGDTANARMILYVSPKLRGRINQALVATNESLIASNNTTNLTTASLIDYNIDVVYTYNSNIPANKALLVLPQGKIQNAVYMQEKSFEREDPDNLNWLKSSFTAIGGLVGENAQTSLIDLAD